jgi:hypothetical protein
MTARFHDYFATKLCALARFLAGIHLVSAAVDSMG